MFEEFGISKELEEKLIETEEEIKDIFKEIDKNALIASKKILKAFINNNVSTSDFSEVTGYGYSDPGRDKLEKIYSEIFNAEDSLVRPQIMSGTHALSISLFGTLKYGDTMLSISGKPYDTLQTVIGIAGDSENSLIKHGIKYEEIDLVNSDFDYEKIKERVSKKDIKLIEIQRSRGYAHRKSLTIDKIEKVIKLIKEIDPDVIVMVDNCYGEFVEDREPTDVGADLMISSLMKNLGGGVATSGGYIVGKKKLIYGIAEHLNAPCVGKDLGANFNQLLSYYKGLFFAPSVVASSLKSMVLASRLLEKYGYKVDPVYNEKRTDIIQTIELETKENLIKFCQGLQSGSPIEAFVTPIPEATPGYPNEEIMAGGSFTPGSTIELSCDGPLIEPYSCYMQGGLSYDYGKLGVLVAIQKMIDNK